MPRRSPTQMTALLWAAGSAILMIVGAIGPWLQALSGVVSVSGLDGDNDGWIVVVVGAAGLLIFCAVALGASHRIAWLLPLIGLIGVVVTAVDRRDVAERDQGGVGITDIFSGTPSTPDLDITVGWGLNLAMGASFSLLLASVVLLLTADKGDRPLKPLA